jgi:hypothetical protein
MKRRLRNYSRNRFRRWQWRKHACQHSLWEAYPDEQLHTQSGLFELPTTAKWKPGTDKLSRKAQNWKFREY